MNINFSEKIIVWRGPAPYYFVPLPEQQSRDLKGISKLVTYGWGVIPVYARIGWTEWKTSLFPRDGRYLVPLKDTVRIAEGLDEGDQVDVSLEIR